MTIIASAYLSMVVMILIPVFALSIQPLAGLRHVCKKQPEYRWITWHLQSISQDSCCPPSWCTALGMLLTELTDTALAVLVPGSLVVCLHLYGAKTMNGGRYGWNLDSQA